MNKIYETPTLVVFINGSDEIFIKNKTSGITLRVGDYGENLIISFYNQRVILVPYNQFKYILTKK